MMPRKKGGSDGSYSDQSPPVHDMTGAGPQFQYGNPPIPGYQPPQGHGGVTLDHGSLPPCDNMFGVNDPMKEQSFSQLKELCNGKVEDGVICLILSQCDWKVEEAAEKILQMSWPDQSHPKPSENINITPYASQGMDNQSKSLKVNVRSRLPSHTSTDTGGLPVLSPKTPNLMPELSDLLPGYNQNKSPVPLHTGLEALNSFGGCNPNVYMDPNASVDAFTNNFGQVDNHVHPSEIHGVGLTPVDSGPVAGALFMQGGPSKDGPGLSTIIEHQRTDSLSPGSTGDHRTSPGYAALASHQFPLEQQETSGGFPSSVGFRVPVPQASNPGRGDSSDTKQVSYPKPPRGSRKKTLSLNPEEREALENLIEDVIMDGVADSDELSTSSEGEDSEVNDSGLEQNLQWPDGKTEAQAKAAGQVGKEGMPKIYPAQLKVAVKHMRNLPPRFMRRLENAQKKIDAAEKQEQDRQRDEQVRVEAEAMEKEREKMKVKEDQKREKKKKIRNLLDDLDQYTDEQNVTEKESEKKVEKVKSKSKGNNKQPRAAPEVDVIQESSQPVHVGLSKGQRANKAQSDDITNELAQQLLGQKLISGHGIPKGMKSNAVNCEDLERELLGEPVTMSSGEPNYAMQMGQQQYLYGYPPGMINPGEKTHLSVDAPEFVPFNSFGVPSQHTGLPFPVPPMVTAGPNSHMQATSSPMPQSDNSSHAYTGRPHLMGANFNPVSNEGPALPADVLRTKTTSTFSGPHGRLSPQVSTALGRLSPQVAPTSNNAGPPNIGAPPMIPHLPPSSLPNDQMKNPAFMVPKLPTNIPPPSSTAGMSSHPGVGVMPMNPYSIPPYPFPGFTPQGFPFRQPFVPPHGFMPWTGDGTPDKHGPQGPPMAHHPLMGMPLKASPQMGRKKGHHQHHHPGPRHPGPAHRPGFVPHGKPPASDIKVMSAEVARKHVQQLLKDGKKVLVILRGCPGSGKSTLAKEIVFEGVILSTDNFFLNNQGAYEYDQSKLDDAHNWNQTKAKQAMEAGTNPVIIDNTNSQAWEMKIYVTFGNKNGYHIEIIEPDTPWRHNAKELTKRNSHQVTLETVRRMLDRYEHNVTLQRIVGTSDKKADEAEKEAVDGEPTAKKTPRRRKKKRRKRNRRNKSSVPEGGAIKDDNQTSDESSDDDTRSKSSTQSLVPMDRRPSSTFTEHETSSPRDTTPEVMDKMEDNWDKRFPEIQEHPPREDKAPSESGTAAQRQHNNTEEAPSAKKNSDDTLQGGNCSRSNARIDNDQEICELNTDEINVNDAQMSDLFNQNKNCDDEILSVNEVKMRNDLNALRINSTNEPEVNTDRNCSENPPNGPDDNDPQNTDALSEIDFKGEVTRFLEDHILQTMVENELVGVVDLQTQQVDLTQSKPSLMDIDSDEDTKGTIADLQKSLEDIGFDNPVFEPDLDIDLDQEYGLSSNPQLSNTTRAKMEDSCPQQKMASTTNDEEVNNAAMNSSTSAAKSASKPRNVKSPRRTSKIAANFPERSSHEPSPSKESTKTEVDKSYWSVPEKAADTYAVQSPKLSLSESDSKECEPTDVQKEMTEPASNSDGKVNEVDSKSNEVEKKTGESTLESPLDVSPKPKSQRKRERKWKESKGNDSTNPWTEDEQSSASTCSAPSTPIHTACGKDTASKEEPENLPVQTSEAVEESQIVNDDKSDKIPLSEQDECTTLMSETPSEKEEHLTASETASTDSEMPATNVASPTTDEKTVLTEETQVAVDGTKEPKTTLEEEPKPDPSDEPLENIQAQPNEDPTPSKETKEELVPTEATPTKSEEETAAIEKPKSADAEHVLSEASLPEGSQRDDKFPFIVRHDYNTKVECKEKNRHQTSELPNASNKDQTEDSDSPDESNSGDIKTSLDEPNSPEAVNLVSKSVQEKVDEDDEQTEKIKSVLKFAEIINQSVDKLHKINTKETVPSPSNTRKTPERKSPAKSAGSSKSASPARSKAKSSPTVKEKSPEKKKEKKDSRNSSQQPSPDKSDAKMKVAKEKSPEKKSDGGNSSRKSSPDKSDAKLSPVKDKSSEKKKENESSAQQTSPDECATEERKSVSPIIVEDELKEVAGEDQTTKVGNVKETETTPKIQETLVESRQTATKVPESNGASTTLKESLPESQDFNKDVSKNITESDSKDLRSDYVENPKDELQAASISKSKTEQPDISKEVVESLEYKTEQPDASKPQIDALVSSEQPDASKQPVGVSISNMEHPNSSEQPLDASFSEIEQPETCEQSLNVSASKPEPHDACKQTVDAAQFNTEQQPDEQPGDSNQSKTEPADASKQQQDAYVMPDVRKKLLNHDWSFPKSPQVPTVSSDDGTLQLPSVVRFAPMSTQTVPRDFSFVNKLSESELDAVLVMGEYNIQEILQATPGRETIQPDTSDEQSQDVTIEEVSSVMKRPLKEKFHKSCQTSAQTESKHDGMNEKVMTLQMCFPEVSEEDLVHILDQCHGDVEWASNILLDGGGHGDMSGPRLEPEGDTVEDETPGEQADTEDDGPEDEVSEFILEKEITAEPPSLVTMCHEALMVQDELVSKGSTSNSAAMSEKDLHKMRELEEMEHQQFMGDVPIDLQNVILEEPNEEEQEELMIESEDADMFRLPPPVSRLEDMKAETVQPAGTNVASSSMENGTSLELSDSNESDSVKLVLPTQLAQQLIQMFGPVQAPFAPVTLSDDDLSIQLDKETAELLHKCWANTLTAKLGGNVPVVEEIEKKQMEDDEAFARQLQEEEYKLMKKSSVGGSVARSSPARGSPFGSPKAKYNPSKASALKYDMSSPVVTYNPATDREPPPSLREIMDEEQALEISKQEYLESLSDARANEGTLSTRLKWQQLLDHFPSVDPLLLDDVFLQNGYSLAETIAAVERRTDTPAQTIDTASERPEEQVFWPAVEESLRQWPEGEERPSAATLYQTLEQPDYSEFRAEAAQHHALRRQYFTKAQDAHRRGMTDVAAFYAQQGHLHSQRLRDASHRAAARIVELKCAVLDLTNSLDLHGLHVPEALATLKGVLSKRETDQRERADRRRTHLVVVTGRGTHSRSGTARIRPAVMEYLRQHAYRWTEPSPSTLKIQLKYRSS